MDGDVGAAAGAARAGPPPRRPADGRRGARHRRARPRRPRLGRRRRAQRRGRRRRRHPRQGARLLRRLRLRRRRDRRLPLNTARPFIFSTAPPPPAVGAAAGGAGAARSRAASGSSACRRTPPLLRAALAAEGLAGRRLRDPDRAGRGRRRGARRWSSASVLLERGVFAQGIRPPTVPEGSSRLRFTVMATHRDGGAARGGAAGRRGRPRARPGRAPRRRPPERRRWSGRGRGIFVTGTGTEVGKTVVAAVHRPYPRRRGPSVAVFKPASPASTSPARADHELLRRAAGSAQSDEEIAPYRYGPPASPHLAAALAGEQIDPARLRAAAAAAAARRRRAGLRGRRRAARAAARPATWSATSPSTSATRWSSPPPRASARSTTRC